MLVLAAGNARSDFVLSVDMDPLAVGIQTTRVVTPGQAFDVGIMLEMTSPTTLSSYAFTTRYDTTELNFNSVVHIPPAGLFLLGHGTNVDPAGSGDIDFGSVTYGQVEVTGAGSFAGGGNNGPISPAILIATLNFTAVAPAGEGVGIVDIKPGYYTAFDGAFDNQVPGVAIPASSTRFLGGTVTAIPEPSSLLLLGSCGVFLLRWRNRRPESRRNCLGSLRWASSGSPISSRQ